MAPEIDDLFSEGSASGRARLGLPMTCVAVGVATAVFGMVCTAAPGGLLVLVGWLLLEREQSRVDSGALPLSATDSIAGALRVTYVAVGVVILLFVTQLLLYCMGYYDVLWGSIFATLRTFI